MMLVFIAIGIRCVLFLFGMSEWVPLVQFSSSTTSYKRLQEGLYLSKRMSPYEGTVFLQPPLLLLPFYLMNEWMVYGLYVAMDVGIAYGLFHIGEMGVKRMKDVSLDMKKKLPLMLAGLYLFNPIIIASCLSLSTVIFRNAALTSLLYYGLKGNVLMASLCLAWASYLTVYPVLLFFPMILLLHSSVQETLFSVSVKMVTSYSSFLFAFFYLSWSFTNYQWDWIYNSYIYPFKLLDLTPNFGAFWYLFTEVFDHFRSYFLCIFHGHIVVYIIPLIIRFKDDPLFLNVIIISMISIFKAYPTFGDIFYHITLLSLYIHLTNHTRYTFVLMLIIIYVVISGPVFFNTWIYTGTGNANFFYFMTLAFLFANVVLLIEFCSAKISINSENSQKKEHAD